MMMLLVSYLMSGGVNSLDEAGVSVDGDAVLQAHLARVGQSVEDPHSVTVAWCDVVWCGVVRCGMVWCRVVWCGVVWCGVVSCDVVWCGVVLCGVVWFGH